MLIAFLDDDDCLRALRLVESLPPDQKPDMAALSAELERVRKQGYALSMGEPVPGAAAISVPVRGHRFLVSLSVLGPESRLTRKRRLELLPEIRKAAASMEAALVGDALEPQAAAG